ncbi:FMN-binding negative transcriptional regulator [Beggiatoa leptomitoformis]|uniref:FMN-binding negative transcriptional regulator n=1 Tax=Beggiatoa leptomitoformis TaxID=288004 RepID=A0A2N9YJA5_9GAMM|nr:FMN-binding negative transcriptional regulator [Beggiatoa leptomitoformis]ALG69508.1 FMN-binding negative transcriptional regulator [Beggiatoa leptomitoformis]AUI70590.1 FMN-binding negative transcriptional regulator [Beggiatoa leptomitoformis]
MYIPKQFEINDVAVMQQLMRDYPLATLISRTAEFINANHIPLMLLSEPPPLGCLQGHIARANPLLQQLLDNPEVLVIFQGAQSYISPSWHPSKQEKHQVVPTWNYTAVHAYGCVRVKDDSQWLKNHLAAMTTQHETAFPNPWKLADAPLEYLAKMLNAIVGIEIHLTKLQGKWKVSQNRTPEDQQGVIEGLQEVGNQEMAALVKQFGVTQF